MTQRREPDFRPLRAADVTSWDLESDVVVVGSGCAGTCAALGAAESGAGALLLEVGGGLGGTSIVSSGVIYAGGGTRIQKACGFEDSPEEMFKYLMASCGPEPDEALVQAFSQHSASHFDWLETQGVPFKESFFPLAYEPPGDDCLLFSGSEHLYPYRDIARPAPRGHAPQVAGAKGPLLMQKLHASARRAGVRDQVGARCERLIVESDGRVVGVAARIEREIRNVRARRGVVLTTGGFIFNEEMVARYAPRLRGCYQLGAGLEDGSGIRMGMAAGAAALRMEAADISITVFPPSPLWSGLLVDRHGQRCINENEYCGQVGERCVLGLGGRMYLVLDDETLESPEAFGGKFLAVGETVAAVEAEAGFPVGALQRTVALYNEYAERGEDPMFHKAAEFLIPLTNPPYAVVDLSSDAIQYSALTLGGLHIDAEARVLDHSGQPIPGLHAAGRTSSGIGKQGYSSGLSLGDSSFFGRRAGRSAARGA